jgi:hypothetical protein
MIVFIGSSWIAGLREQWRRNDLFDPLVGARDMSVDRYEVDIFRELDERHDVVMVEFAELVHCHRHRLNAKCRQSVLDHPHRERLLSFGVQPIDNGARSLGRKG